MLSFELYKEIHNSLLQLISITLNDFYNIGTKEKLNDWNENTVRFVLAAQLSLFILSRFSSWLLERLYWTIHYVNNDLSLNKYF